MSRANVGPVVDHWGDAGGTVRGWACVVVTFAGQHVCLLLLEPARVTVVMLAWRACSAAVGIRKCLAYSTCCTAHNTCNTDSESTWRWCVRRLWLCRSERCEGHVLSHAHTQTGLHTHTHMHTYTYTHIHTYTHTHAYAHGLIMHTHLLGPPALGRVTETATLSHVFNSGIGF